MSITLNYIYIYIYTYIYRHHQVAQLAQISLTVSLHSPLSPSLTLGLQTTFFVDTEPLAVVGEYLMVVQHWHVHV